MVSVSADDENFKKILEETIRTIGDERKQKVSNANPNIMMQTVSCSSEDDEFMQKLTDKIETLFKRSLPPLIGGIYGDFIRSVLFEYHYDLEQLRFKEELAMNNLDAFVRDLQATHDSFDAFQAAWHGSVQLVETFLNEFPTFKDKPGPWGTTLLYSAARNNHKPVVQYLLEDARCSVNAQNKQHLERALLSATITAADYQVLPTLGSTALHGACYGGHLAVVEYLINHGADYFIRNQAEENALANAEFYPDLVKYFRNLLNLGYLKEEVRLPETRITQVDQKSSKDCIWEFLPSRDSAWLPFQENEANRLRQSLLVKEGKPFEREIQWNMAYTVSMIQFFRRGNQQDELAWIRCRGSSIFNFDCHALWQLFFVEHPKVQPNSSGRMSMKVLDLSMVSEREMKIELGAWYNCDSKTNASLDEFMNNRRRRVSICVIDDQLDVDLFKFTFTNPQGTMSGFIRWIPKLISSVDYKKHHIVAIDNFQTSTSLELTPLTTQHLRQLSKSQKTGTADQEQISRR